MHPLTWSYMCVLSSSLSWLPRAEESSLTLFLAMWARFEEDEIILVFWVIDDWPSWLYWGCMASNRITLLCWVVAPLGFSLARIFWMKIFPTVGIFWLVSFFLGLHFTTIHYPCVATSWNSVAGGDTFSVLWLGLGVTPAPCLICVPWLSTTHWDSGMVGQARATWP